MRTAYPGVRTHRPATVHAHAVRAWAVVTSVDPLRVWMFDGGLVVFRVREAASGDEVPEEQPLGFNLWTQDRAKTIVWRCKPLGPHTSRLPSG